MKDGKWPRPSGRASEPKYLSRNASHFVKRHLLLARYRHIPTPRQPRSARGDSSCANQGVWDLDRNALGGNVIFGAWGAPKGTFGAGVQNFINVSMAPTGGGQPVSVIPPSLALLYCKKS